jgi:hypothetical protein
MGHPCALLTALATQNHMYGNSRCNTHSFSCCNERVHFYTSNQYPFQPTPQSVFDQETWKYGCDLCWLTKNYTSHKIPSHTTTKNVSTARSGPNKTLATLCKQPQATGNTSSWCLQTSILRNLGSALVFTCAANMQSDMHGLNDAGQAAPCKAIWWPTRNSHLSICSLLHQLEHKINTGCHEAQTHHSHAWPRTCIASEIRQQCSTHGSRTSEWGERKGGGKRRNKSAGKPVAARGTGLRVRRAWGGRVGRGMHSQATGAAHANRWMIPKVCHVYNYRKRDAEPPCLRADPLNT